MNSHANYSPEKLLQHLISEINLQFGHEKGDCFRQTVANCQLVDSDEHKFARQITIAYMAYAELGLGIAGIEAAFIYDYPVSKKYPACVDTPHMELLLRGIHVILKLNTTKVKVHSENFRKLLLVLAGDIQVVLVLLAIVLYKVRNIEEYTDQEKKMLLRDTKHLYAPLAHRLGLYRIKTTMEDFIMQQEEPEIYHVIKARLKESEQKRLDFIEGFLQPIKQRLLADGCNCSFKYRTKSVSSIWKKMKKQKVDIDDIKDLLAIRIIDESGDHNEKESCWRIYSIVTDLYIPDPKRLRDWITVPKVSGYESLHTTVRGRDNRWVEVQIRTARMDFIAEKGPAAHWSYKDGGISSSEKWLARYRNILEGSDEHMNSPSPSLMSEGIDNEIFTLSPQGDLVKLPAGATLLDFAFDIHSELGLRCKGGMVNGKIIPIKYVLKNADVVEIITGNQPQPSEGWLQIVVTTKARNKIRRALREIEAKQFNEGKETLMRKFRQWKIPFGDEALNRLLQQLKIKDVVKLYKMIATDEIAVSTIKKLMLSSAEQEKHIVEEANREPEVKARKSFDTRDNLLLINNEMKTGAYHAAPCCNPVFGDEVFGFVTVSKGIRIHRNSCTNAIDLRTRYPYRVIDVKWVSSGDTGPLAATLRITGKDELGVLNRITQVISEDMKVMMRSLQVESKNDEFFVATMKVSVKDSRHLDFLLHKLRKIKAVEKVIRI